ncbi:hypothetical protein RchiOBHm_Chr5g0025951 [Rosa chinensis]|uniref:Uncharacterized protein n=1 Tax=Rosa chinensis TaxID=74649 RepID=A0A2P6Q8Q2_ROSCH|nr:hypothetical protein RchiOBHm_Chr5g0025951 [Rosa chinensis]
MKYVELPILSYFFSKNYIEAAKHLNPIFPRKAGFEKLQFIAFGTALGEDTEQQ